MTQPYLPDTKYDPHKKPAGPKWSDKDIRKDVVVPFLRLIGGPKRAALGVGAMGALPYYAYAKHNKLEWPGLRTGLLLFPLLAGASYYGLKPGKRKNYSTDDWINSLGIKTDDMPLADKTSSDLFFRPTLFDAVADLPGFGTAQKNFLALGVSAAPGGSNISLPELSHGFSAVTNGATGGLLPKITAGIEGAIIGNAFSRVLGLTPTSRKWVTGVSAVADSLWGNKLVKAIGNIYD